MKNKLIFYFVLLLSLLSVCNYTIAQDNRLSCADEEVFKTIYFQLHAPQRLFFLKSDKVIDILKIKKGMNIAGIGAGAGIFTFRFAEELKGTECLLISAMR